MRIVVIEPARLAGKLLEFVLTDAGHEAILIPTAAKALSAVIGRETDAVLLQGDLPHPGPDGLTLAKELRGQRYTGPLLFMAPWPETAEKLRAFAVGADDYLVTPFDPAELLARVEAISRRFRHADRQGLGTILKAGNAELSIGELTYRVEGRPPAELTPTEMRMLECLMRNQGIIIGRETLIERTWGYDLVGDTNRVDVYIRRIRRKVERDPAIPEYLHTVRGVGYTFRPPSPTYLTALPASLGAANTRDWEERGVAD